MSSRTGTRRQAERNPHGALRSASVWRRYSYAWVTGAFFLLTASGHWAFGWFAYVEEQRQHRESVSVSGYVIEMSRDTLENWQSEFLQLLWQVGGLAFLLFVASPQSREGDSRKEAKIDAILHAVSPKDAEKLISEIDRQFDR